ncbi:hypothetical protein Prudu_001472 [Prunus dulcis]|uniref:Uncharacterized protein n=1 Tax=Prunus dulcis TaxID=3755 RepID=A0A4Y1QNM1_PRUDU|nr:hypothetical protein Prudu_001472 [Prunus dulcis]
MVQADGVADDVASQVDAERLPLKSLLLASPNGEHQGPLERLREAWRPPFKKFLAHPASPLGRFFSGLRLQTEAFSRHPASPLGRSLWATV